jgi:hypothetical protein
MALPDQSDPERVAARATWVFFRELEGAIVEAMVLDGLSIERAYIAAIGKKFASEAPVAPQIHVRPSGDRLCLYCSKKLPATDPTTAVIAKP